MSKKENGSDSAQLLYQDRGGDWLPVLKLKKHPISPDELEIVEYTQNNNTPREETVDKKSLARLLRKQGEASSYLESPILTPYLESLGVTQPQYEVMKKFDEVFWKAFTKTGFRELKNKFNASFSVEERELKNNCILYFTMMGSTPPRIPPIPDRPYVFDINGKFETLIPELERLANS
ncbi:hypothetical protein ACFL1Q_01025 [Patescibacteria group bacterium]